MRSTEDKRGTKSFRVGVTGGIGSGKSFVCKVIEQIGYPVYYCDQRAKELMVSDRTIISRLTELLGAQVYVTNDKGCLVLNKPVVEKYIFASAEHTGIINSIVHPVVKSDFLRWAEEQESDIVFVESAIFKEAGFLDSLDAVIGVTAPLDLRIQRVIKRDNTTPERIEARIRQQSSDYEIMEFCQFVIINDGTSPLEEQIKSIIKRLKVNYKR